MFGAKCLQKSLCWLAAVSLLLVVLFRGGAKSLHFETTAKDDIAVGQYLSYIQIHNMEELLLESVIVN